MTKIREKNPVEKALEDPENRRLMEYEWFVDEIMCRLQQKMEEMHLQRKDLAERLRCSPANVSQLLKRGSNMTLKTIMDLALALDHRFLAPELQSRCEAAPWEPPPRRRAGDKTDRRRTPK